MAHSRPADETIGALNQLLLMYGAEEIVVDLDEAPDGMTIASNGFIRWPVPKDYQASPTTVIVAVTTPSGQEVFHSFDLAMAK